MAFTNKEMKLARLGYAYANREQGNGLKAIVRDLRGKTRADVYFDHNAYEIHQGESV